MRTASEQALNERNASIVRDYSTGGITQQALAERYGLSRVQIQRIVGVVGRRLKYNPAEVVALFASGRTRKEVADALGMSYGSLSNYIARHKLMVPKRKAGRPRKAPQPSCNRVESTTPCG